MTVRDIAEIVIFAIAAIWGIYQTRVTSRLEQEIHRLNAGLDQSIQRLHRAREAIIQSHKAEIFLLLYREANTETTEQYYTKHAELSAYKAELRGLAFAIDDKKLLDLVNRDYQADSPTVYEMRIRNRSQRLHTRISELLEESTRKNTRSSPNLKNLFHRKTPNR